jgi:parallel beta-helix repeat protein
MIPDHEGFEIVSNAIEVSEGIDTTVAGNDLIGNWLGVFIEDSPGTKILSNDISRSGYVGTFVIGPKSANAKFVGNNISGSPLGIYVSDTHHGSFVGNNIHDNCAGMYFEAKASQRVGDIEVKVHFEAKASQPVGDIEVKGNTVENNTRPCPAPQFDTAFSGIGIALIGARDMEVTGNRISGNVPSGPTAVSGGVVVSTDPFIGGTTKPTNNSVTGNLLGHNKPDIFWDESGSGNSFLGNLCNSSVPSSLCN